MYNIREVILLINSKIWERAIISEVALAVHVAPANMKAVHTDRPYHGFVINTPGSGRTYYFSDGTVLRILILCSYCWICT